MRKSPALSIVLFAPAAFAVLLLPIPRRWRKVHRALTIIASSLMFAFSLRLWTAFDPDEPGFGLGKYRQLRGHLFNHSVP